MNAIMKCLVLAAIMVSMHSTAHSRHTGWPVTGTLARSDSAIQYYVMDSIKTLPAVSASTLGGIVSLQGTVSDETQRETIIKALLDIPGVLSVDAQLLEIQDVGMEKIN